MPMQILFLIFSDYCVWASHVAIIVLLKPQVIILARESGLKLELSDVKIVNLVPEPLRVRSKHKLSISC